MKKRFLLMMFYCFVALPSVFATGMFRPIIMVYHNQINIPPGVIPLSLDQPMPCDIEAYQTEDGIEIIVNDVSLSGFYQISVFDHRLDRVYNTSVLFYDGASAFISTDLWPEDTYYLQIIIPGGWLEGEFEIED